ncbi:MAG: LamG domain-containing protein [Victivallaceae bacterium]|nr:LamG domain-containing protein [Victivallaceae bacterium]
MFKKMIFSRQLMGLVAVFALLGTVFTTKADGIKPQQFQGEEVTGDNVLGIWQFQPSAELADGKGQADLTLKGQAKILPDEIFGGVLECFDNPPGVDKPNGAVTAWNKGPTPEKAFSIEAWVKLKKNPENPKWATAYLVDKNYVPRTHKNKSFNKDYYFNLRQQRQGKTIILQAGIGLGDEVISFSSSPVEYAPEVWRHLVFSYDGSGTGMFFVDGQMVGKKTHPGKGAAAPGSRNLSLGERCGSTYMGLPGYLAQVRIVKGLPNSIKLIGVNVEHTHQRTVFERLEKEHKLQIKLSNLTEQPINDLVLKVHDGLSQWEHKVGTLPPGDTLAAIDLPLSCLGKVGKYQFQVEAQGISNGQKVGGNGSLDYQLCRRLPEFMPVIMWGGASIEQMKRVGFTHSLHWMDHLDMASWKAGKPLGFSKSFNELRLTLDQIMAEELRVLGKISPGQYFKKQAAYAEARKSYLVQDRQGNPGKDVDFSLPRIQQFAFDVGRSVANNVGMYPAVDLVLTDSEFRDRSQLSFRAEDREAFKTATGLEIPDVVKSKSGVKYQQLKNFPTNRIIPDDDPILSYYRWLWERGDGYPGFLSQSRRGLAGGKDSHLKALWDPVVRCPAKWGSGGEVDMVSHWTYTYPDPLVMGLATDEVLAMAKGGPEYQQPGTMTQIIWYRSQTTGPLPKDKNKWTAWEKELPDTRFITIPPDILEIALWQKLSRPIKAIMYHGAGSLWYKGKTGGYDFTNPETEPRLAALIAKVVKPFGPMLLKVPERPAKVAMLESFASQMFYGGITYGNMSGPVGRAHAMLTRAYLQPDIIYDETIIRDGLDQYKVLMLPVCPVLTEKVAACIKTWQGKGGIVVADELLAPGITPDILLRQLQQNSVSKEESIATARQLRQELGKAVTPFAEANTEDAVLHVRRYGSSDYLFAFNDKRAFGDYVGQYRKVMEKGQPLSATLSIHRTKGTVYDLLAGQVVPTSAKDGKLSFQADFTAGEGRLYLITEEPLSTVKLETANQVNLGDSLDIRISVLDAADKPINAVVPLRLDGTNAQGQPIEICGWYAAEGGQLAMKLDLAPNDIPGTWNITVQELASGKKVQKSFTVK